MVDKVTKCAGSALPVSKIGCWPSSVRRRSPGLETWLPLSSVQIFPIFAGSLLITTALLSPRYLIHRKKIEDPYQTFLQQKQIRVWANRSTGSLWDSRPLRANPERFKDTMSFHRCFYNPSQTIEQKKTHSNSNWEPLDTRAGIR